MKVIKPRYYSENEQLIVRFENEYGASIVSHSGSYGYEEGQVELAVLKWYGPGNYDFHLCYDTYITDDVIGHLTTDEANAIVEQIKEL